MIKEKIFVCCAIGLFGLIGLGLLRAAFLELRRVARARRRLIRITGTVLTTAKVTEHRPGGSHHESNLIHKFFPVIAYTTPEGQRVEFRSETGRTHHARRGYSGKTVEPPREWRDGQSIEILHDPAGEMKPCLTGVFALWGMGIGMAAASLMFLGATSFMVFLAIRRVFV